MNEQNTVNIGGLSALVESLQTLMARARANKDDELMSQCTTFLHQSADAHNIGELKRFIDDNYDNRHNRN